MEQKVDTSRAERRKLQFKNIDELLAEADRIIASEKSGKLRRTGNWSVGQAFGHIASWINYGYEGYPGRAPPFFIRWIIRRKLKHYLTNGMPSGVHIPGVKSGTHGIGEKSTQVGADQLRNACNRLKSGQPCKFDSPAFGPLSHEDRVALNLRHAELHLGFLHP